MTPTLIPAAAIVAVAAAGIVGLRPLPYRVRFGFDLICFLAISGFFLKWGMFPVFPAAGVSDAASGLWLRAIGGGWWLLGARLSVAAMRYTLHHDRRSRQARLFSDLMAAAIYIAAGMIVLNFVLALPITGLLATSSVVAVFVGLALQNTLADVFSGIAVGLDQPFRVGDRISIGGSIEGDVIQANWRSIRVQTDDEDVAIIPNSLIAKAEIVNRCIPSTRRAASVNLSCPNGAAPEQVIDALLQSTLLAPAILQSPPPSAALTWLGSKRNSYVISFFVGDSKQVATAKSSLLKHCRRQLYYADMLFGASSPVGAPPSGHPGRQLLGELVLFESLSAQQLDQLADHLEIVLAEPGEVLFTQGAADATLYLMTAGVLEFTRKVRDDQVEKIGCIGAGEYVGELGLLTGAPHAATATARAHCQIYRLPHDAIAPLLAEHADLAAAFDRSARRGLAILHREVASRASEDIGATGLLLQRIRNFFRTP
ncbi:MAG TPA: mechanosensitive ion channel family protein [Caulobacteraceae bacterium]|jgi:small-conductance mechanosensitive channel/CRP-like cAMP-binding protein